MKRHLVYLLAVFMLLGCEGKFKTWKSYNTQWLEDNKVSLGTNPDVKEFYIIERSGIQYEVIHRGYGAKPKPTVDKDTELSSVIKVKYKGWLVDGTMFESSDESYLELGSCIQGWKDVLSQMEQGSIVKMYLPASSAYGEDGSKDNYGNFRVPPHSTLIFEVSMIDVINY